MTRGIFVFISRHQWFLSGCVRASPEQVAAMQEQKCRSFGAQPGTQAYMACRMQLEHQVHEDRMQDRALLSAALNSDGPFHFEPAPAFPAGPMAPGPNWNNNSLRCQTRNTGLGQSETNCQ